ncbi:MAG: hypothetical protein PHE33_06775 [Bacteroidales bacterium]|nr:hypothetical protein [Bacteroidales bacterium]
MSTKKPTGSEIISIDELPPKLDELKAIVKSPADIDNATKALDIPPFLLNLYLATSTNLSFLNIGLNEAVYIPRQITDRDGGRKSQYLLSKGETTQAGVFMADSGMMLRYVTRLTGESEYAQTGDIYREQYITRDGKLIYEADGTLEIVDITKGIGKYILLQTKTPQYAQVTEEPEVVWILWSLIFVKKDKTL